MKEYYKILMKSPLFSSIAAHEFDIMLKCLNARLVDYRKKNIIFMAGSPADRVGLVLEGSIQVVREDVLGNRTLIAMLSAGNLFGEAFACANVETLPISVIAANDCKILLINYRQIITTCSSSCTFHNQLIENMLKILAEKNLMLNQRMETLSAKTTREKLMAYLTAQASATGKKTFTIPFTRQELADYLTVDRSALSREISSMRKNGLIRSDKNIFELID